MSAFLELGRPRAFKTRREICAFGKSLAVKGVRNIGTLYDSGEITFLGRVDLQK